MNIKQRKKTMMLVSFTKGYYKPPYPYSLRVRGVTVHAQWTLFRKRKDEKLVVKKPGYFLVSAGCGVCKGYGSVYRNTYCELENCVCVTNYDGIYSKRLYRF